MTAKGNEESTGENCHLYISVVNAITLHSCTIKLQYSAWGLLKAYAACPTPRLNQSYELRPPWEQHLRYVPHRVRNGYNTRWPKEYSFVLSKGMDELHVCCLEVSIVPTAWSECDFNQEQETYSWGNTNPPSTPLSGCLVKYMVFR